MGKFRQITTKLLQFILSNLLWELIKSLYLPIGGAALMGVATIIFGWLRHLDWLTIGFYAIPIFLFALLIFIILWIKFQDKLKIRVAGKPQTTFISGLGSYVSYYVNGSFRLTNLGKECTIEGIYCKLVVGKKNIAKGFVYGDANHFTYIPTGWRIRQLDTTQEPIDFYCNALVNLYDLQKLVRFDLEKAKLELIIEATGTKARIQFPTIHKSIYKVNQP